MFNYCGSKNSVILREIKQHWPKPYTFSCYVEPFVGAGSVFSHFETTSTFLNDANGDVMNVYWAVKHDYETFAQKLQDYDRTPCSTSERFNELRERFNMGKRQKKTDITEQAALYVVLQNHAFGSQSRYNKDGMYNSGFANRSKSSFDAAKYAKFRKKLRCSSTVLCQGHFKQVIECAGKGSFTYVDSPYDECFNQYTPETFTKDDHKELAKELRALHARGGKFLMSNSDTPFIRQLYEGFLIFPVTVQQPLRCPTRPGSRSRAEILVKNYDGPDCELISLSVEDDLRPTKRRRVIAEVNLEEDETDDYCITIATDLSGTDAPVFALQALQVPFRHLWSSDKDKNARETIKANHKPELLFEDISNRNHFQLPKTPTLYVSCIPCKSFSSAGNNKGFEDPRSEVVFEVIKTIEITRPKIAILESVKLNSDALDTVMKELSIIPRFNWCHKVLNTSDSGIPQNRERLYIVGIQGDVSASQFEWPELQVQKRLLTEFMDSSDTCSVPWTREAVNLNCVPENAVFVDAGFLHKPQSKFLSMRAPTVCANSQYYNFHYHRPATVAEYRSLQGFPASFKEVVSNTALKKLFGNAMSVPVIQGVIKNALAAISTSVCDSVNSPQSKKAIVEHTATKRRRVIADDSSDNESDLEDESNCNKEQFPWRTYTSSALLDDYQRTQMKFKQKQGAYTCEESMPHSNLGYMCTNVFFQFERMRTSGLGGSRADAVEFWSRSANAVQIYSRKVKRDLFSTVNFFSHSPSQFPILTAAKFYNFFGATAVLDPYAGWGDRCLASMLANVDYIGFDSNTRLEKPYQQLVSQYPHDNKIKMNFQPCEDANLDDLKFDLLFSSPPWFDENRVMVEMYHGAETDYGTFMTKSLVPVVTDTIYKKIPVALHLPSHMYEDLAKEVGPCQNKYHFNTARSKQQTIYYWSEYAHVGITSFVPPVCDSVKSSQSKKGTKK